MPYEVRVYRDPHRAWAVPRRFETLQEARTEALEHIVDSHDGNGCDAEEWKELEIRAQRIPPDGGRLGPLPDGYVIEVKRNGPRRRWA